MICTVNSVDCLGERDDSQAEYLGWALSAIFPTLFKTAYNFNLLIVIFLKKISTHYLWTLV